MTKILARQVRIGLCDDEQPCSAEARDTTSGNQWWYCSLDPDHRGPHVGIYENSNGELVAGLIWTEEDAPPLE